ncbi:MAG: hypothetical protein JKY52_20280 [Flavobacteriales bacterium]|nr:hypothetical protein [Flavobacteriales bacterium]
MSKEDLIQSENRWKEITLCANNLFNKNAFDEAKSQYDTALKEAGKLVSHFNSCTNIKIPVVPIFVISCNNLANTYQELGDSSLAEVQLRRAVFFIIHLKEQEDLSPQVTESLQRELSKVVLTYSEFCKKTNQEDKSEKVFQNLSFN